MSWKIRVSTNSSIMLPISIQAIHIGRSLLSSAYISKNRQASGMTTVGFILGMAHVVRLTSYAESTREAHR
jgi:hypothetical protein